MQLFFRVTALLLLVGVVACGKKHDETTTQTTTTQQSPTGIGAKPHENVVFVPMDYSKAAVNEPMPPIDEAKPPPRSLMRGQLQSFDNVKVRGWGNVYRMQDGSIQLRIDSLEIEGVSGALDVVLLDATSAVDANAVSNGKNIGPLKGLSGRMGYPLGPEMLGRFNTLALVMHGDNRLVASARLQ